MQTQGQMKAAVYNAVIGNATINGIISGRMQWLLKPTIAQTFPLMTYQMLDTSGSYVNNSSIQLSHEKVDMQIDIYTANGDIIKADTLHDALKVVMNGLGYMQIAGGEFIDSDLQKVVRSTRWSVWNV